MVTIYNLWWQPRLGPKTHWTYATVSIIKQGNIDNSKSNVRPVKGKPREVCIYIFVRK